MNKEKGKKRTITSWQQTVLRSCHHDFQGLSRQDAASKLDVSYQAIKSVLQAVKKVLPTYFPILTPLERLCYRWWALEGYTAIEVAEHLKITLCSVQNALRRARSKGIWWPGKRGKLLSYDQYQKGDYNWIDKHYIRQF